MRRQISNSLDYAVERAGDIIQAVAEQETDEKKKEKLKRIVKEIREYINAIS